MNMDEVTYVTQWHKRKLQFDSLIYEPPKKRNIQNVNKTAQCLPSMCPLASTNRKRTLVNWCRTVIETNPSEFRCRHFGYFPFFHILVRQGHWKYAYCALFTFELSIFMLIRFSYDSSSKAQFKENINAWKLPCSPLNYANCHRTKPINESIRSCHGNG